MIVSMYSALEDANRAIKLDKSWAKGYYRQGKAYVGLKVEDNTVLYVPLMLHVATLTFFYEECLYSQKLDLAESSFVSAIKYDPNYQEALDELHRIRVEQMIVSSLTHTTP